MKTPRTPRPRNRRTGEEAEARSFIGLWRKQSDEPCASQYPAVLELQAGGRYLGRSEPAGEYVVWDVGTWSLVSPGEVAISNAYDKVIRYRYEMAGSELRFVDPEGCSFGYICQAGAPDSG